MSLPYSAIKIKHAENGDPVTQGLLDRIPNNIKQSFSEEQLHGLKIALNQQKWRQHPIDLRTSIPFWRWRFYFVLVAGKDLRNVSRQRELFFHRTEIFFLTLFIFMCVVFGLLIIYLVKSFLGIDIFDNFSLGIFNWFKSLF